MVICGMVLLKIRLESGPVTADRTTIVVHSYKLLTNDVKHVHSLNKGLLHTVHFIHNFIWQHHHNK